jgi:hypothetical protein
MAKADERLDTSIRFVGGELNDDHPPDLLRLYLAKGAVRELTELDKSKSKWLAHIQAAIDVSKAGVEGISLDSGDPLNPRLLPLQELSDDAEKIGAAIVTMKWKSLNNHSIQEIETWSECDEEVARQVAHIAARRGQPLTGLDADDAQLIAGTTMALSRDATLFDDLNDRLGEALQVSYQNDKVFQGWPPQA